MAEPVNIPVLPLGAMRRRKSDTAAELRNTPLNDVGADEDRQIRPLSRTQIVWVSLRAYPIVPVIIFPRKSAKHNSNGTRTANGHT